MNVVTKDEGESAKFLCNYPKLVIQSKKAKGKVRSCESEGAIVVSLLRHRNFVKIRVSYFDPSTDVINIFSMF